VTGTGVDPTAERILRTLSRIAVVGCSTHPAKAAHSVPAAMQAAGYTVVPVHPSAEEILDVPAVRRLADVPAPVELVSLFRPAAEAPELARQAVAAGARALWLQLGLRSAQARRIAEEAGLLYVEDRCIAVDRARLRARPG
jgi:predicted CoA-binding protein